MGDLLTQPQPARSKPARVTAADIKSALRRRYAQHDWAILFEVGDATGARHTRFADALAMSLWPSRGLELHGMEIKVSRYDWQHERLNPQKAETIAAYCDRWWLVTGPGVVQKSDEIPPAWGWIDFDGHQLMVVKEAAKTDAVTCDRRFLAALLRRAHKTDDAVIEAELVKRDAAREEAFQQRVKEFADRRVGQATDVLKNVEAFEAASGFIISNAEFRGWASSSAEIGRAVKLVRDLKIADHGYDSLLTMMARFRDRFDDMAAVMTTAGIGLPQNKTTDPKKRRSSKATRA